MRSNRLARLLVAVCVLPHELGHALPARLAGLRPEIAVLPAWQGDGQPLAQFNAAVDATTPTWVIRLVALAPLVLALGVAALAGPALPPESPLTFPLLVALSFWGGLSQGDLAVAADPRAVRETGEFLAPSSPATASAMLLLTPATVLGVSVLLLQ